MKRLILLRHGKSDWNASYAGDHERPLNRRGTEAARTVAARLAAAREAPDLIITSSALRARSTAALAIEAAGWDCPVEVSSELYGASVPKVLAVIRGQVDEVTRLMLVGHEPTWSGLADLLTGVAVRVTTATAVGIDLVDWAAAEPGAGSVAFVFHPKD